RRRGLSAAEISKRGYRTADVAGIARAVDDLLDRHGREGLLTVPGFQDRGGRVTFGAVRGLLIPVRAMGGVVVAIKIRHDTSENGPKYSWASSREVSCGNPDLKEALEKRQPSPDLAARVCHAGVATLTGRIRGRVRYSQARNTPFQGLAADGAAL